MIGKSADEKVERDEKFLAVQIMHCQSKCCMMCNNYLDNATAEQVIENYFTIQTCHCKRRGLARSVRILGAILMDSIDRTAAIMPKLLFGRLCILITARQTVAKRNPCVVSETIELTEAGICSKAEANL